MPRRTPLVAPPKVPPQGGEEEAASLDADFEDTLLRSLLQAKVYGLAKRTPLDYAPRFSRQVDSQVWFKREDLQPGFSFKVRGAYNRLAHLSPAERRRGVVCVSAGNHAQGVALAARQLGLHAQVVMPRTTPAIKVSAVRAAQAEVILDGDSYDEAALRCAAEQQRSGAVLVHPFDDPLVIAGQGSIGLELFQQAEALDAVFVPVGGGGLIAGIGGALKLLGAKARIIGVEPHNSNAMQAALARQARVALPSVGRFADGVAVAQVGRWTFSLAQRYVDDIVLVSVDEICSAIKAIYEDTRAVVEPAGALGAAGLRKYVQAQGWRGKHLVAINSGANTNFDRLQFVAERALTGEGGEALFSVTLPERRGALRAFCQEVVGERGITEFNYRFSKGSGQAHIFIGISTPAPTERHIFTEILRSKGYAYVDLTENDLAKTHIRHMVGGRTNGTQHERLFRFRFPERPKALLDFLQAMSPEWNISLFHYRMHGADFGRVLIGLEIPPADEHAFTRFLAQLGFFHQEETDNPAYRLFL